MSSGKEKPKASRFRFPWWVVACLTTVATFWCIFTLSSSAGRERELMERNYLLQGEALIRGMSAAAYRGWANQTVTTEDYREIAEIGKADFIAMTDMNAEVKASSEPEVLTTGTFPRPEPPEVFQNNEAKHKVFAAGGREVFWIYRPLEVALLPVSSSGIMDRRPSRAPASPEIEKEAGAAGGGRNSDPNAPRQQTKLPASSLTPDRTFYFWVGYDMSIFKAQEAAEKARFVMVTVGTAAAGIGFVMFLLWFYYWGLSKRRQRDAESRAETIISNISSGLFLTDTDGTVTLVNDQAERISGLPRSRIVDRSIGDLMVKAPLSAEEAEKVCGLEREAVEGRSLGEILSSMSGLAEGKFTANEMPATFAGEGGAPGHEAIVSISAGTYCTDELKPLGMAVLMTDVKELVESRRRMAEQDLLAGLGAMARHVAHEIRNPLSSIKGFTQHLIAKTDEREIDPAAFGEALRKVLTSVNRLKDTVTEVLDYGRPADVTTRPVDMGRLLTSIKEFVAYDPDWGGAVFDVTLPSEGRPVVAKVDEALFSEGLLNLFLNAVQAVDMNPPERPGKVTAELAG
ncbi:MAG: PAS domain-containing protein, partial [Deltaproteobacteria bacterium]|nr:PAS domain-containing protein [Deltaproteobacteria bacterium]